MAKVALITGASKRIGACMARNIHQSGLNVVIHYHRNKTAAEQLVGELNAQRKDSACCVSFDLLQQQHCCALIEYCLNRFSRLDVLVNNASNFYPTALEDVAEEDWQSLMNIHVKSPLFLCQQASRQLKKNRGCIINIADIHGQVPLAGHLLYSTAKAALIMLTRALAKELAPEIRVNAISPGAIAWPENMQEPEKDAILEKIPLRRPGNKQDIAEAALFLIHRADYITGQIISVDGGRELYS